MNKIIFSILSLLMLAGCSNDYSNEQKAKPLERTVHIKMNTAINKGEQEILRIAVFEFFMTCQPLKQKYLDDIEYHCCPK